MTRTYALAAATVLDLAPPQVIEVAAAAGYQACGFRLNPVRPGEVAPDMFGDTAMKREALARLRDTDIKVLDVEVFWLNESKRVRDMLPVLELAHELGAQFALTPIDVPDPGRAADMFGQLCDLAAPLGITCALEFISWTHVGTLAKAQDVRRRANRRNSSVLVDALHLHRTGGAPRDLAGQAISGYAQICDARSGTLSAPEALAEEAKFDRLMPGDGVIPLVDFVAALPHDLPLSVEVASTDLSTRLSPVERARQMLAKTKAIDAQATALRAKE